MEKLPLSIRIKLWNRERLKKARIAKILKSSPTIRRKAPFPKKVNRILLLDSQIGWGDYLYCLGLLKKLKAANILIDVITLPENYKRYINIPYIRKAFPMGSKASIDAISEQEYDIAVDLGYVNDNFWDLRLPILSVLKCYIITVSDFAKDSKLFNEFLDLSIENHWSKRMAIIYNRILNASDCQSISPNYPIIENTFTANNFISRWDKNTHIYINTVARINDRNLSESQIQGLVDLLNKRKKSIGIFYTDYKIEESHWVKLLPKMPFNDFVSVVNNCKAIISPDTSVIHIGSAFNIPVFGIFCGNYRDYWNKYSMQEAWSPISDNSMIYVEDDPDTTENSDFIYTHPKRSLSLYDFKNLEKPISIFLDNLNL